MLLWGCSPTHPHLTTLALLYSGSSSLHRTKGLSFHWCHTGHPLLHMGPSMCTLWLVILSLDVWRVWFLVHWYCCSSYGAANPFLSFSPFPNSSIGVPMLIPMVGCEHQHLYLSVSGTTSQETTISGSCQKALFGICHCILVRCLYIDGCPGWAVSGWPFLQSLIHT